ncbi:zinc finger protein 507 [Limanda limanda]|uniref:zinc finger protein 507 n=1 Tax=Limanda limanda TaxID=27771 RepID=UPI0029C66D66|nr:zinc finger protein 507 [Limanda limanda]XP_060924554.1 zinc finger protein 507 [Limanda limanda]
MEEISSVAVLNTHSSTSSSSSADPSAVESPAQSQTRQAVKEEPSQIFQLKQAPNSLIRVIEKLSKIVEKRPQRSCISAAQKRAFQQASSARGGGDDGAKGSRGSSPIKKIKRNVKLVKTDGSTADRALSPPVSGDSNNNNVTSTVTEICDNSNSSNQKWTVTCYQCSLCPFLSQTLPLLKEHLKQHNEQNSDVILMCSECRFTSRDQGQLEAHVRLHFDNGGNLKRDYPPSDTYSDGKEDVLRNQDGDWTGSSGSTGTEVIKSSADSSKELPQKKKWYSYEEYGLYRCLICSYVCSQQRMLKTHAWKHAGLVDCSYPIFEEDIGAPAIREFKAAANPATTREEMVVFSPALQDKGLQKLPTGFKLQLCVPLGVDSKQDLLNQPVSDVDESPDTAEEEEEHAYSIKDLTSEEPLVEVQVMTLAESEVEIDGHHDSGSITDSLLSSAQKIINSSPNSAGRINVIVERLPSAEDSVMAPNPLLLSPDVDRDKSLQDVEEPERDHIGAVKEEEVLGWSADAADSPASSADIKSSVTISSNSPRDENVPPASRKRTHSESLRLHSLAAEALVAMPMRTPELCTSILKAQDVGTTAALLDLGLHREDSEEEELGPLGLREGDEEGPTTKAGISLSLLTVIERLRERSDQNASDEDILKELQDNAQFQNGAVAGVVTGSGAGSYTCAIPRMDGLVASPDGGLVDYLPGSERPYRCRLCRYSSSNKGYIKHHLRVHRQRQPYQCPICDHIASDSLDLESHMIHHCKTRMYRCKQCPDAFHYKSQLRNHEREHHSFSSDMAAFTAVTEAAAAVEEAEREADHDCAKQKMYKCDVCDYTSSTYVGVRNHRRIHNSDKPYRCCSCDFATTNMNSLKSHMRRHPQEHQAVQLLEQYRCSLCGYVCSHPPSLKSHMWKHAGDQNYNYEQVNQAINEAISQSSRTPQKLSAVPESVADHPAVAHPSKDRVKAPVEQITPTLTTAAVDPAADSSTGLHTPTTDPSQWSAESPSPPDSDPAQIPSQSQSQPVGQTPVPGPSMEYCVLLFCCCICGYESTSKERLMEHMKEHEGDIISIILNKEQQQQQQQQAEVQPSLQTAE